MKHRSHKGNDESFGVIYHSNIGLIGSQGDVGSSG